MKIAYNTLVICANLIGLAAATFVGQAADADEDGIDDADESQLLQRFAPILKRDGIVNAPQEGVGVPVAVAWLLRNSDIIRYTQTPPYPVLVARPSVAQAVQAVSGAADPQFLHIRNAHIWGDAPGDGTSWPVAIQRGDGIYGRVWQPYSDQPHLYSIQYFVLLTWNETAYSGGFGNHEGDWLCLDLTVDVRSSKTDPPVIFAIYHNHGRQLFLNPEAIEIENGRPVAYLEGGTNELWPNAGGRGFGGWPARDGFATNGNFDWDDVGPWYGELLAIFVGGLNEHKIVREHRGTGNRYETHRILNIGGHNRNGQPVSLCGAEGEFILRYAGRWGHESDEADCPEGPPFQGKLWSRDWNREGRPSGPWTPGLGPFGGGGATARTDYGDLDPIRYCGECPPGFHLWTSPGHTFTVPRLRPVTYVDFAAAPPGLGTSAWPYRDILLGLAMTEANGTLITRGGRTSQRLQISQPVTVTSEGRITTIGQ